MSIPTSIGLLYAKEITINSTKEKCLKILAVKGVCETYYCENIKDIGVMRLTFLSSKVSRNWIKRPDSDTIDYRINKKNAELFLF